ncbi:hypothetical protein EUA41_13585 [Bacillus velezensis]|uniref:hypothetical protein n=1 Tax=Bacillus velezensis TaxID=492670 RepID=UPI0011ABDE68|nr:hypothetical protein [Bacillus velezensis]TWO93422.1 hypothetical protein EUA41_13585 [Bacillus velezensis]
MNIEVKVRTAHGTIVWDAKEKKSSFISNEEAAKPEKEQATPQEPTADKTEGKTTKGTKGKASAKEKETADSQ